MQKKTLNILMVEDNAGDVYMVREALDEIGFPYALDVVTDGSTALDFLGRNDEEKPDLIILDLNLPGKNGRQVLAEIQATPRLRRLPVAVLSTSWSESEIGKEFPRLCSMFASKTSDFRRLIDIIKRFRSFAEQHAEA